MKQLYSAVCVFISSFIFSQAGYEIKIDLKGSKDTMMYLVKYTWDQQYISDTCKKVKDGKVIFKGGKNLEKGVYTLVSQAKSVYFDFFINESARFGISADVNDIPNTLKSIGNKENEKFFSYIRFITNKNKEFNKYREGTKGKSREDSAKFMNDKLKGMNDEVKAFETDFMNSVKGTFLYDVLNLKTEKEAKDVPLAKNGRPDSVYRYYYYKSHFFDGVNFADDRIIRTPFFDDRVKRFFDNVIMMHPDTVIEAIDKMLSQCRPDSIVYNSLVGFFTYKYEQSKIMGFDKVFCHMATKYIVPGKAAKVYSDEVRMKIKERADIVCNLLIDSKVADLFMIDTTYGRQVKKMGFDTAKTSKSVTDLYYKNLEKLTPMFRNLYGVNAKYTVLVFWASDCGHCQTEIPKLQENLNTLKGKIDVKVYAVQTKDDFEEWRKFIIKNKLEFINVFDPIHLNDLKVRFDIYSTPVIYILDKEKRIKAKRLASEQVVDMLKMLENAEKAKQGSK